MGTIIARSKTSAFDLKLAFGEEAEGRLERILAAKGDTVEVKCEPKYAQTGNVALEFEQRNPLGGTKPSGIHPASTQSQWWAIEFLPERWLILPTEQLRELGRTEYELTGAVQMGDNGNRGVLLPLASIIDPWMVSPHERRLPVSLREAA